VLQYVHSPGREPEYVNCIYSSYLSTTLIGTDEDLGSTHSVTQEMFSVTQSQIKCLTDMQTVHRLESHKPQNDLLALFHSVFRELLD
jgi:hypothetical protein